MEAYPLHWPAGWPRTKQPERARFDVTFARARDALFNELRLMGARYPVLSSNLELRRDGLPYSGQRQPADPGIALYFEYNGRQMSFACDRWDRTEDNVRAIGKTIEAIRGIERWGASDMMERAFSAFEALPAPRGWRDVLNVASDADLEATKRAYRERLKEVHPDTGGSGEAFHDVQAAWQAAQQHFGA
jgi:hypothetical protein